VLSFLSGMCLVDKRFRLSNPLLTASLLTFAAVLADQLAAPSLHTSTPLWAMLALFLLVWRRGEIPLAKFLTSLRLTAWRVMLFLALHLALTLAARSFLAAPPVSLSGLTGSPEHPGWLLAALKLVVLLPTLVLFPLRAWRILALSYRPEFIAALVVLLTFFPRRAMDALWPWYGQVLGHVVYLLAWPLTPSLGYVQGLYPVITGPSLDVTILLGCSGFNGVELFDYLFGLVAFCDWNRLRKGRALIAYFAGILAMLLGNALRISSMVVFGNRGFAAQVLRFHVSAGSLFFSAAFLVYLPIVYRWMLVRRRVSPTPQPAPATD
jgi:exosortase/archaeosortase family protein